MQYTPGPRGRDPTLGLVRRTHTTGQHPPLATFASIAFSECVPIRHNGHEWIGGECHDQDA
jgi:hypothetical protein